jgi:ABC-type multidrug transport system fused ATPase/permease subunit
MIAGIVIGFIYGWQLTLLMLLILPLFALGTYVNMKLRHGNQNRDTRLLEDAGQTAAEAIENIRTVQSLTREVPVYETFCHYLERPHKQSLRSTQIQAVSYAFSQCIVFFFYAACFRFGGYLVMQNAMLPLDVFKVFFVIMFCGMTIGWATAYFPEMFKAKVAAGLILKMISERPKIDNYSTAGLMTDYKGSVTFDSVYFSYPTRTNAPILRGVGFQVQSGKTIALVGSSGCGKSTVVSLLERFYDPVDGRVLIDDIDLRTFNIRYAREQLALVSQEPTLFDFSIADNISYGLTGVSRERIMDAAKLANIHETIMSFPEGYNTRVGEKGVQLSGGQKQRIAIARALVRNPKVLLLDEATSALDTENEKIVQDALDRAREGRTCIVIAHRLSTIQSADCIIVLKNGRIVEQGTHSELVSKRGPYYELTKRQQLQK